MSFRTSVTASEIYTHRAYRMARSVWLRAVKYDIIMKRKVLMKEEKM